ncbi:MAG: ABC transporter permease [Acidimicrobiia bacterium]
MPDTLQTPKTPETPRGVVRGAPSESSWAPLKRLQRILVQTAGIAVLVGAWFLVTELKLWSEVIVPRPSAVWAALLDATSTRDGQRGLSGYLLWEHLGASLARVLQGLFWGIVVGVPLGLLLGTVPWFRVASEPFVNFVRSLPPLAYFSLLIIWFGIDDTSKIWLLFLAAFAPIAIATMAGVEAVRRQRVEAARSLGASNRQVLVHTVLPSALPDIFTGVRLAVGFAWTTIVAAETSNGIPGIGGLAWSTKKELRTDVAILCVIVIGITAIALDSVVRTAERLIVPWKGKG